MRATLVFVHLTLAFAACGGDAHPDAGVDAGHDASASVDAGRDAAVGVDAGNLDAGDVDAGGLDSGTDAATAPTTGTIVPLYTDPSDATWTQLAAAATAHPTVAVVAVINPNSGPTPTADPAYTSGIAALQAAGVTVVGYVATGYGARAQSAVEADIDLYASEYPTLDGIFYDEAAIYEAGHEGLYGAEAVHARTAGFDFLVANPGTTPLDAYAAPFDVSMVYESDGAPPETALARFATARTHCAIIPYAVATLDAAYVASIRPDVEYVYLTDDDLPNPWDTLPTYFDALLTALE